MSKMKVRLKAHQNIYIHNDIGNAAFYFKKRADERIAKDDREGVGHEIVAGLTLLAFEVEARFNFLGARLITNWNERAPAKEKVETVCSHLSVTVDFSTRPYSSIAKLKAFRDMLAHGKPEEKILDEEIEATVEELDALEFPRGAWEAYLDQAFLSQAYTDVEQVWKELLTKSELTVFDTLTHGTRHISFIKHVDEKPA